MTAKNNITGDAIKTKGITTDAYRDSWERIFGKNKNKSEDVDGVRISDTPSTDDHGLHQEPK